MKEEVVPEVVEESEYMKQWKSIPKSKRERLSKKQIEKMDKKDTLSDAIQISS